MCLQLKRFEKIIEFFQHFDFQITEDEDNFFKIHIQFLNLKFNKILTK